ncbi:hypothetical protein EHM69_04815 [candidate division KSB1 bacterium]|nr:MAG: hypothetical protein EHM69_04815 [candidate division KSB1 bacterium]
MKHASRTLIPLCLALILCTVIGCDDDGDNPPEVVSINFISAPTALLANVDSLYEYTVQISGLASGERVDSVYCEIHLPNGQPAIGFSLFDDGSELSWPGHPYASDPSGDIAAHNNKFTRRINARLLANNVTGVYTFAFRAMMGGTEKVRADLNINIQSVSMPYLTQWPQDSVFNECFDPIPMEVRVVRDNIDRVDSLWVDIIETGVGSRISNRIYFDPHNGDTIWHVSFTPNAFSCSNSSPPLYYNLEYEAKTRFGFTANQSQHIHSFLNDFPVLSNPSMPDTIERPTAMGDTDTVKITIHLADCELVGIPGYNGLRFDVSRDDTIHWATANNYILYDDGNLLDDVSGDGIFTTGLRINRRDDLPDNEYYFRFYAIECAAPYDTSLYVMDSMRVIQPPAGMPAISPAENTIGFEVIH